jgi:hypothetical protein
MHRHAYQPRILVIVGLLLSGMPALLLVDHPSSALQVGATIGLLLAGALGAVALSRWANAPHPGEG